MQQPELLTPSVCCGQVPLAVYIIYSPSILANKLYSRTTASVTFLAISAGAKPQPTSLCILRHTRNTDVYSTAAKRV